MLTEQPRKPWLFYGYIVVGAAFVIQMLTWGIYNSYGVLFSSLLAEFSWPRAVISGAMSVSQFLVGVGAIFLGNLNDRFGPRVLMVYVGVMVGVGYFLISQVNSIWQLYLFQGVIVGIGISGTDVILLSTTARWFVRRRGLMSGIVKIGTGVGFMVAPLVITWLISGYGWRTAYGAVGITLFVCIVLGAQLLRRSPAQMNILPDGDRVLNTSEIMTAEVGYSLRQAARTRSFWTLCLAYFVVFFCTLAIVVHFAPYSIDLGQSAAFGAAMVSVIGGASIAGRFLMGLTSDRIGSRRALIACFFAFTGAFLWLQFARDSWGLIAFALVYGFCHGGFYTLISPTVAEYFGMRSHGGIFGFIVFSGSVGGSLGPFIVGRIFDLSGSYSSSFLLLLGLAAAGLLAVLVSGEGKAGALGMGGIS